ncbi:MAG: phosphatase PAP2 family protein [Bacteroidota bacterium]
MWERLLQWDRETFIYLNSQGVAAYDSFWCSVTEIYNWIPLFLFFIGLLFFKFPRREAISRLITLLVLVVFITLLTYFTKITVARPRPNNDLEINGLIRILKTPTDYSFFSGHAASSFSITVLVCLFLFRRWKWALLFFVWPVLFSWSRIYVGVHFPLDIITGALVGTSIGFLCYYLHYRFTIPGSRLSHL